MTKRVLLSLALLLFAVSAFAQVQDWQIDPNHSAAQFSVKHLGISTVRGAFSKLSGTVQYDPNDVSKTVINATIEASSIDTRVQMRDNDLKSASYFDVQKYPTITFKSKKVEKGSDGKLKVTGDLTIKGNTKEVTLDVEPTAPINNPQQMGGGQRMGASATTKINRQDFGVSGGGGMVGNDIAIELDIEMIRKGAGAAKGGM